jgi:hypothetical protein
VYNNVIKDAPNELKSRRHFPLAGGSRMTDKERIALGAIAGALVAIIGYPLTGFESIAAYKSEGAFEEGLILAAGLALRAVGFAFLGGLWAYLHRSESDRLKVFQLGLIGPAMVSAMVSANLNKIEGDPVQPVAFNLPGLIALAYAQTTTPTGTLKPSSWDILIRGILGTTVVKEIRK